MFRAKWQRSKDAKKKLIVRIIENYQNLIIQLQSNILLILKSVDILILLSYNKLYLKRLSRVIP
jgi:hypothetical protein